MQSSFGKLNFRDIGKGFLIAFLSGLFLELIVFFQAGILPSWEELGQKGLVGLSAGLAYLVKNVFTNSENKLLKKENGTK